MCLETQQDIMENDNDTPGIPTATDNGAWKRAIDKVVPCCVVLKVTLTRAVDTEAASSAYATGFVVDKARGIILTNRHVITPGPIVAEAIFLNREEVPVHALYYDPVHDFGFLRFDPSKIQFMEIDEVPLAPEAACVGTEIRVVGNDSGEKVSILAGVLARLDRDAPVYGRKSYNDFNTFYLQAGSGTKGGSSGSPVIDILGRAVGLNAGGKNKAASAYYLPLERVVRALRMIQASKPLGSPAGSWSAPVIPRGDLQVTFVFKGFDEVRRLGLQQHTERDVRATPGRTHGSAAAGDAGLSTTGMLVVDSVLPGGPADGTLEAGDVLVRINSVIVTHFLHLEELLDAAVGTDVSVEWERAGKPMEAQLKVADIHAITPASFLEVSGGTVQALSYQQARNNRVVAGQVYVAEPGFMLGRATVPKHAIITALDGHPVPDLARFATILRALPHGARVPVEFFTFNSRHRRESGIVHMDRQWYGPPVYWTRDDASGCWHSTTNWPPGSKDPSETPQNPSATTTAQDTETVNANAQATQPDVEMADGTPGRTTRRSNKGKGTAAAVAAVEQCDNGTVSVMSDVQLEERLRCSMVLVDVDIPLVALSDGVHARSFAGNGVIVHHGEKVGLVLVDRNTVVVGPCDVTISFGAHPSEVPGTVRFLHPLHNFALVSYDPQLLPPQARAKVQAAELLPNPPVKRGDTLVLAGLTKFLRIMQRKSTVTTATSAASIAMPEVPRFRAVHEELIKVDQDFGATFSGILTDQQGRVRALWGSYSEQVEKEEREWCAGLPAHTFYPWVQKVAALETQQRALPPPVRTLDAELEPLLLSKAAQFGLPNDWVSKLDTHDPERRQVLRVKSTVAKSHASEVLKSGDMVLAINDQPVTCFGDVEACIAELGSGAKSGKQKKRGADQPSGHQNGTTPRKTRKGAKGTPKTVETAQDDVAQEDSPAAVDACLAPTMESTQTAEDQQVAVNGVDSKQGPSVPITIFRGKEIINVSVQLGCEDGMGTHRLVHWCGAQLQAPHRAVRELGYLPAASGVYISRWHHGSPAHRYELNAFVCYQPRRYGLYALHWITEVDGTPTPDLDAFLKVVEPLKHGDFVLVKLCHLETAQPKVLTMKMDLIYWCGQSDWQLVMQLKADPYYP